MRHTVVRAERTKVVRLERGEPAEPGHKRSNNRPIVRIHLLGSMRGTSYLGDDILPRGKKVRALLGCLCLAAGERIPRDRLASMLWDRTSDDQARTRLRQALLELQRAMGPLAHELVWSDADDIGLNVNLCWIDALAVLASEPPDLSALQSDLAALCTGRLLEGLDGLSASFDQWLLGERLRFSERLRALDEAELHRLDPSTVDARLHNGASAEALRPRSKPRNDAAPPVRGRLRVGVLPFLATGSIDEDMAFSLSQEIAGGLARFRWFDVIAPVSLAPEPSGSFTGVDQLRRTELDYVVEGVLSGHGEKLQIVVRLLDFARYARPVWSERFDVAVGQLHQLDELLTARIVGQIDPIILHIEGQPRRRVHYGATGLLLLAIPLMYSMERKKFEEAGRLINRALQIDPDNAMVSAWAAHWQVYYVGQGWAEDPVQAFATAQERARKAIKLDPDNAEALGICAHMCSFLEKDFDTAIAYFDRALRLNPNAASIWAFSALTYTYVGEPEAALQRLERYRDLAPFDPYFGLFEYAYAIAYVFKGDYEKAASVGRRVVKANPEFVNGYKPLIASLGHLGRRDKAKPYIKKLLALESNFTVERFGQVFPFRKATDRQHYMDGLRLAGVPDT